MMEVKRVTRGWLDRGIWDVLMDERNCFDSRRELSFPSAIISKSNGPSLVTRTI